MKKIKLGLLCLILIVGLCACGKEEQEGKYNIYCLNQTETALTESKFTPKSTDTKGMIEELIDQLSKGTEEVSEVRPCSEEEVRILDYDLDKKQLILYFGMDYSTLPKEKEVLTRAAIVQTLTQIDGVDYVSFYVGENPLMDSNKNPIGLMTSEDFVESAGEDMEAIQSTTITLYFANSNGDKLIPETQQVHYNSNISMEKMIVERLIAGPETEGLKACIPAETGIISISVKDGTCYLDLSDGFLVNSSTDVTEQIPIYGIVNSLTELSMINKVKISINGNDKKVFREDIQLNTAFERNMDLVQNTAK